MEKVNYIDLLKNLSINNIQKISKNKLSIKQRQQLGIKYLSFSTIKYFY
jgi:hypothetical protein